MLARGSAYRDYMTPEELETERTLARAEGRVVRSSWRDAPAEAFEEEKVAQVQAAGDEGSGSGSGPGSASGDG